MANDISYVLRLSVVALTVAVAAPMLAQETSLTSAQVPTPVKTAVVKQFPNGEVSHWSKETEDGKTTYEASVKDKAGKRDVVVSPDGSLVAIEEAIQLSALPLQAKNAITSKYPKAKLQKAEKISHDGQVDFEVDLANAAHKEVTVTGDGKITKEE